MKNLTGYTNNTRSFSMKYLSIFLLSFVLFNCSNQITSPLDLFEQNSNQSESYKDDDPEPYGIVKHQSYSTVELSVEEKNNILMFTGVFLMPNTGYKYSHIIVYTENKMLIIEIYGKVNSNIDYCDVIAEMPAKFQILDTEKQIIIRSINEDYIVKNSKKQFKELEQEMEKN